MSVKTTDLARFLPSDSTGFKVRDNPKNGFTVVELDFFADPEKRDPSWAEREKKKISPKRWAVEYMRSWVTFKGRPVYEDVFYTNIHVSADPIPPDPNFPIIRGWDFGGNQSCIITQLVGNQLRVLNELPNRGKNTRTFAPEVVKFCNSRYGEGHFYLDIIDPSAMWEGKTATGAACADVMREIGLSPKPAVTNDPQRRIDAVTKLLMGVHEDRRTLLISPDCPLLIKGFEGGYHYPEKPTQAQRMDRPVKNLYSHIHDALQYAALRVNMYSEEPDHDEEIAYEATRYAFE